MRRRVEDYSLRIAIVDANERFRSELSRKLLQNQHVVSVDQFEDGESFWRRSVRRGYDLLFLDTDLPLMSGAELLQRLLSRRTCPLVIIISNDNDESTVMKFIRRGGVVGYIWKNEIHRVSDVISIIQTGGSIVSPRIAKMLLHQFRPKRLRLAQLTARENEVLVALVSGASTLDGAQQMGIAPSTMRKHIQNIYEKLGVRNRMELAKKARENGLM